MKALCDAGVSCFKIEGRMKSPIYAAGVTSVYRSVLDSILEGTALKDRDRLYDTLLALGNRSGFTDGYITGRKSQMISWEKPSHEHAKQSEDTKVFLSDAFAGEPKVSVLLSARFMVGEEMELTLACGTKNVTVYGKRVARAMQSPTSVKQIKEKLGQLGNTPFVAAKITVEADPDIFLSVKDIKDLRRDAIQMYFRTYGQARTKEDIFPERMLSPVSYYQVPQEIALRVLVFSKEQLTAVLGYPEVNGVILDCHGFTGESFSDAVIKVRSAGKLVFLALPVLFRDKEWESYKEMIAMLRQLDGLLVRSFDEIAFCNAYDLSFTTDANMYAFNDAAVAALSSMHALGNTVPLELNVQEIRNRDPHNTEMILYGYYPLMTTVSCVYRNAFDACKCDLAHKEDKKKELMLSDRMKKQFIVKTFCDICANRIYNSLPTDLSGRMEEVLRLPIRSFRMDFTVENAEETHAAMHRVLGALAGQGIAKEDKREVTYGHFKRGVE